MPSWGPAAAENRKGRYALRPEDMMPVSPSVIELKVPQNAYDNPGFIADKEFPNPPPPVYNGFGGVHVEKEKNDVPSTSSTSSSGNYEKDTGFDFEFSNYNQLSLTGPSGLQE